MAAPKLEQRPAAPAEARGGKPAPEPAAPPVAQTMVAVPPAPAAVPRCRAARLRAARARLRAARSGVRSACAAGLCSAATASACGAAGTASARQDHRAHSDHQQVPRPAADVPDALAASPRVVHDAESQRTQPVCVTSSLRRDTVRLPSPSRKTTCGHSAVSVSPSRRTVLKGALSLPFCPLLGFTTERRRSPVPADPFTLGRRVG